MFNIMGKRKVAIIDTHPIVLGGLTQIINHEADLTVCAEITDFAAALPAVTASRPDIVIIDISDKEAGHGIDLVKAVASAHPDTPVIVLSMRNESFYAEIAFRAGAKGYISMSESPCQIIAAVRKVLDNCIHVSETMATDIISRLAGNSKSGQDGMTMYGFTDRELEVFLHIGQGLTVRQIAEKFHRSVKTIEAHREHIKKKLKLGNTTELLRHAVQWVEYQRSAT
ncbi:MAG: DNA-binding response regulator [Planctomycetaceae bacterium]|nr:MAG: DNA-binding response regulator [Planctomycetaceae bacterium]